MSLTYRQKPATREECRLWEARKSYNPRTGRKIKSSGEIYKKFPSLK